MNIAACNVCTFAHVLGKRHQGDTQDHAECCMSVVDFVLVCYLSLTVVHVVRRQILLVFAVQLSHSHLLHLLWYAKPSKSIFANGCAVLLFGMHVIFCVRNHNKTFDVQSSLPCLASC